VSGTFYYLCSVLDGYSRSIIHWDLQESMTEAEIDVILERTRGKYPEAKPRSEENGDSVLPNLQLEAYVRHATYGA
jgi:putative transposase